MHEVFNIKIFKTHPKNCIKTSLILKNPKIFQKPENLGFKTWNACKWEIRNIPSEEKTLKMLEKEVWSERKWFGRREDKAIEREIERNENQITQNLYIEVQ